MRKSAFHIPVIYLISSIIILMGGVAVFLYSNTAHLNTSPSRSFLLTVFYLLFLASLTVSFFSLITLKTKFARRTDLLLPIFVLFIGILVFVSHYFHFPSALYSTELFTHATFAIHSIQTSVGQIFLDAGLFLIFSYTCFKCYGFHQLTIKNKKITFAYSVISILFVFAVFFFISLIITHVIIDSNIILDPDKVAFFDFHSYILFFIFFILFYAFSLIAYKVIKTNLYLFHEKKRQVVWTTLIALFIATLLIIFLCPKHESVSSLYILMIFVLYLVFCFILIGKKHHFFKFNTLFGNLISFSILTTFLLFIVLNQYEKNYRNELVNNIIANDKKDLEQTFHSGRTDIISHYSCAYFIDYQLKEQYGNFKYVSNILKFVNKSKNNSFERRNYRHYVYRISDNEIILISKKADMVFNKAAAFAFCMIIGGIYLLFILILSCFFVRIRFQQFSFRERIIWSSLIALLLISIIICSISVHILMNNFAEKHENILINKITSISQYFDDENISYSCDSANTACLNNQLVRLSKVFNTGITIYDPAGKLLAHSGAEPTDNKKLKIINNTLLTSIIIDKITLYVDKKLEDGNLIIMIYRPVFDNKNDIVSILNLNFEANKAEFQSNLSALIMQFFTIYAFIIFVAILFSWMMYWYISKPLEKIKKEFNASDYNGQINIQWNDNDEIGRLIKEHNNMVNALKNNAAKLAVSERQSAWREMAQEIAHEIKNPLTPMRLNIQMLQQAWKDKRDNFDTRFQKTTQDIITQIDQLSKTADLFNEFAISENAVIQKENLGNLLHDFENKAVDNSRIKFIFHYDKEKNYDALVEKMQFNKMLELLTESAFQNQKPDEQLTITFTLSDNDEKNWLLDVKDNSKGLTIDTKKSPFTFNFSADGCISGLNLPIVKNIVLNFKGNITLSTEENKGAEYRIIIPKC